MKYLLIGVAMLQAILSCQVSQKKGNPDELSFLALGDSYTIGEGVSEQERWPNILAESWQSEGIKIGEPNIIARTGWRCDNLYQATLNTDISEQYDLISIAIGVNNQYQGRNLKEFEKQLELLTNWAIEHAKKGKESLFFLSIPDYGVTPYAGKSGKKASKELLAWNACIESFCGKKGIRFIDITPLSQEAKNNTALLAEDGLHPSGLMYQQWVDKIRKELPVPSK